MSRWFIVLAGASLLMGGCGKSELHLWYYFGEIHDYHFRNLLNHLWRQFPFSVVPRKFGSIRELEDSLLKVSEDNLPDVALTYPSTVKALYEAGRLQPVDTTEVKPVLPGYCEFGGKKYCWPLFKSFVGFYLNVPLAQQVGLDTVFRLEDLLNLNTEYVVLGMYVSSTLYTAFTFTYASEGMSLKDACVEAGRLYYGLLHRPYVRLYPSPYRAQEDVVLERIVLLPGTSAYAPYIEREGIALKFVPLINRKGEKVLFLSGPDLVLLKGGERKMATTFVKALYSTLEKDTVWRRFGYIPAITLREKNIYHDMNFNVPRQEIRELIRSFVGADSLDLNAVERVCEKFRRLEW